MRGYRFGVDWIARNDDAGNGDSEEVVADYVTTLLLADLSGKDAATVARDVMRARAKIEKEESRS